MLLATVAAILAGAISIAGTNPCPTGEAVSAELDRLGALAFRGAVTRSSNPERGKSWTP